MIPIKSIYKAIQIKKINFNRRNTVNMYKRNTYLALFFSVFITMDAFAGKWFVINGDDSSGVIIRSDKKPSPKNPKYKVFSAKEIEIMNKYQVEIMKDKYASITDEQLNVEMEKFFKVKKEKLNEMSIYFHVIQSGLSNNKIKDTTKNTKLVTAQAIRKVLSNIKDLKIKIHYQYGGAYMGKRLIKLSLPLKIGTASKRIHSAREEARDIIKRLATYKNEVGEVMFNFTSEKEVMFKTVFNFSKVRPYDEYIHKMFR